MIHIWKLKIWCILTMVSVLSAENSELTLSINMKSPIFNTDLLNNLVWFINGHYNILPAHFLITSNYLNNFSLSLDNPMNLLSNYSAGVLNVTIWFSKMSDNKQIEFYEYMENIYPVALNESVNITKVVVFCNDCCMSSTAGDDAFKGKYIFKTTLVNTTAFVSCRYNANQNKTASRFCNWNSLKKGYWEDASLTDCKTNATMQLILLSQIPFCYGVKTSNNCSSPDNKLQRLEEVQKIPSIYASPEDLNLVTTLLREIFLNSSAKRDMAAKVFNMIDIMLSTKRSLVTQFQIGNNASNKILNFLALVANTNVEELKKSNESYVNYSFKNLGLTLTYVNTVDTQAINHMEINASVDIMDAVSACNQKRVDWNASILIPGAILNSSEILFSMVFKNPALFLSNNDSVTLQIDQEGNRTNGSGVIVSSIISAVLQHPIKDLKTPIKISYKNIDQISMNGHLDCYFWNSTLDIWSNAGCRKVFEDSFEVKCECNHLTSFALILDTSQRGYNPLTLQIVTWVGSVISLGALVLSMLALLLFRKWLNHLSLKILLYLCISLMALIVIFLAGARRRSKNLVSCRVIAGLLQYFILATFFWTAVEAISLYKNFVTVFRTVDTVKFMRIASLFAWGVPLLIVAISAGVARGSFGDCDLCLLRGNAFYFGVLTPVSLILVSNFIVLVLVMISLSTRKIEKLMANQEKIGLYRRILRSSRIAFAFSILLGLSWFFAIVAVGKAMETFQWLFCIFNSLQGLFLFVQYIVRNRDLQEKVRLLWRSLTWKPPKKKAVNYSFTNNTFVHPTDTSSVAPVDSSNVELKSVSNLEST